MKKQNGYQSIHTVVLGPLGRPVEIQIRTRQMHEDSELGVAAHWRYKEGSVAGKDGANDEKIGWLRKLLQWQEDVVESADLAEELRNQVIEDRVYVFTPKGDIVDLPMGSTPLDFALRALECRPSLYRCENFRPHSAFYVSVEDR